MIVIGQQIVFNIEKLIKTIGKPIRITHINKYTGTYPYNMCTKKFNIFYFMKLNFSPLSLSVYHTLGYLRFEFLLMLN
jgi:hypothetical protein